MDHLEILARTLNKIRTNRAEITRLRREIEKNLYDRPKNARAGFNQASLKDQIETIRNHHSYGKDDCIRSLLGKERWNSNEDHEDWEYRFNELNSNLAKHNDLEEENLRLYNMVKEVGMIAGTKITFDDIYPRKIRVNGRNVSITKFIADQLAEDILLGDDDE